MRTESVRISHLKEHETKRSVLLRFLLVLLVFVTYLAYVIYKFGIENGIAVAFLSWSAFVLATPIADAGFLLDFPIRVLLRVKMVVSEAFVWIFALGLNLYFLLTNPEIYQSTYLLKLFYKILTTPMPYWFIILLSFAGTFLSVYIADELFSKVKKHELNLSAKYKYTHRLVLAVAAFAIVLFLYYELVYLLNIELTH